MNKYIIICGPLSSGKTSLASILSEAFDIGPLYESLDTNLFFKNFYKDMQKWGFHTAISFLIRAIEVQKEIKSFLDIKSICQDWHVLEHHEVYNWVMRKNDILSEREYSVCGQLNRILKSLLIKPNLVIYLKTNSNTILERVYKRRRKEELEGLTLDYIDSLVQRYSQWIDSLNSPVFQIDTSNIDFVNRESDKQFIINQVKEKAFTIEV